MRRWGTATFLLPNIYGRPFRALPWALEFFCGRQGRYASVFRMWRGLRFSAFDARGLKDAGRTLWNARRALRMLLSREWAFRAAGRRVWRSRVARIIYCGGVGWCAWRAAARSSARIWGGVWRKKRFAVGRMGGECRADRKEEKNGETRCLRLAMALSVGAGVRGRCDGCMPWCWFRFRPGAGGCLVAGRVGMRGGDGCSPCCVGLGCSWRHGGALRCCLPGGGWALPVFYAWLCAWFVRATR